MAKQIFTNAASCKLGAAIVTTDPITSITLEAGQGAEFPSPTGGDWFVLAIWKANKSAMELFKITSRSGDVLTVDTRAFDGSTANTFGTTDICLCVVNAGALSDFRADLTTLDARLDTAESDIDAIEADVDTIFTQKPRMDTGTKVVFHQAAAPTGWTQDTSINDRVLRLVSGTGAGTGGSWTISGLTVDGHTLTEDEIPAHVHGGVQTPAGNGFGPPGGGNNFGTPGSTSSTGGGDAHDHGLTADGNWRPAYTDVIVCARTT